MISRAKAYKLRELIVKASASLEDSDALEGIELFDEWATDTEYTVDKRVRYEGILYRVLQEHTSQSDWTPDKAVSLFVRVDDPSIEFPEWRQPTGAHDAYAEGAKVSHNGKHWISTIPANTYEPGVYGWDEVA
jgi:hypothetical protein